MSGLGCSLDVFLNEGVDAFMTNPTIADLDNVMMIARINTRLLSNIIDVDVEDFGNAWYNALGRFVADIAHKSGEGRHETTNGKGFLGEATDFNIFD